MKDKTYKIVFLVLTLAGTLFSGYLSGVKFFTKICAFNEGCPFFLGHPACYYGFGMFLLMFLVSLISILRKSIKVETAAAWLTLISFLGILFAGSFVINEPSKITTCSYGLIFYIIIFILSLIKTNKDERI